MFYFGAKCREISLRLARKQNQICLRASRESNIKIFSALRAKAISKFSARFARKQNQKCLRASRECDIQIFSALRANAILEFSPRFARKPIQKSFGATYSTILSEKKGWGSLRSGNLFMAKNNRSGQCDQNAYFFIKLGAILEG